MQSCLGNWVAIGRAVVYYARGAHALSAVTVHWFWLEACDKVTSGLWFAGGFSSCLHHK